MKKETQKSTILPAISLREKDVLLSVPNTLPGYYKWWARSDSLNKVLNSPALSKKYKEELLPYLTKKVINKEEYYYIYVGVAIRESIRDRLNWHVNQHHTKTSVVSGFLSTLRQTISSLVAEDQYNETLTNDFIDELYVEYYSVNLPIKSDEAKIYIEQIEKDELKYNLIPLNLRDNKNIQLKPFLSELKNARKKAKQKDVI